MKQLDSRVLPVRLLLLLLAVLLAPTAHAGSFDIANGDVAGLIAAIHAANGNGEDDVIHLAPGGTYTLTAADNSGFYGNTGLPVIGSPILIDGHGATLERSSAPGTPEFRIFLVGNLTAQLTLRELTVTGGVADSLGYGGGALLNTGIARLESCTISANSGGIGGGIFNYCGALTVLNSTLTGNTSFQGYGGGGILNFSSHCLSTVTIVSSTLFENRADGPAPGRGDAIADAFSPPGSIVVKNSIFASLTQGLGDDFYMPAGVLASLGHNLAGDVSGALAAPGDQNSTDPSLSPLADNGGATWTHAPLVGSPVLDAVPLADCTDDLGAPITTDQRGIARPQGDDCDIGSVERVVLPPCAAALPPYPPAFFPSVVQVRVAGPNGCEFLTTGVVVDARWVLTVGLDVEGLLPSALLVFDGTTDLAVSDIEFADAPWAYDSSGYPVTGNLALLGLEAPTTAPVASLPAGNSNFVGQTVSLPWYGTALPDLSFENGTVISDAQAAFLWSQLGVSLTPEHLGVNNLFCADVPGPLFAFEGSQPVLAGMGSFFATDPSGAPSTDDPTIFTRVSSHLPWIGATIANLPVAASSTWTNLGYALPGVTGNPLLLGTGPLTAGSAGALTLCNAAPSALSLFFVGLSSTPTSFKCGTLLPVPIVFSLSIVTNPAGELSIPWASWPAGLGGTSISYQYGIQDSAAICGVAISNALRADVP